MLHTYKAYTLNVRKTHLHIFIYFRSILFSYFSTHRRSVHAAISLGSPQTFEGDRAEGQAQERQQAVETRRGGNLDEPRRR